MLSYISVFLSILFTYPSDTIRRRIIQTNSSSYKYNGFFDCARKICRQEGVRGLFSGGTVIFLQSVTSATIYFIIDRIIRDVKIIESYWGGIIYRRNIGEWKNLCMDGLSMCFFNSVFIYQSLKVRLSA